jgi:hypothetical protein
MDMKNRVLSTAALAFALLLPAAAFGQSFGAAPSLGDPVVGQSLSGLGSGPDSGVEVSGELYAKGMETPSNVPLIRGQIGRDEYEMSLRLHPLAQREATEAGKGEDESLRTTQAEFYRVMTHKTVRIITDRALRDQIGSLVSYGRPVEIAGSVSDEASPMLTVQDILPPNEDVRVTKTRGSLEAEATGPASSSELASKK